MLEASGQLEASPALLKRRAWKLLTGTLLRYILLFLVQHLCCLFVVCTDIIASSCKYVVFPTT